MNIKINPAKTIKQNRSATLAIRLTVWFLILSTLPLVVMLLFIRGNISERLRAMEINMEQRQTKEFASNLSTQETGNFYPILVSASSASKNYFTIDPEGLILEHPNPLVRNTFFRDYHGYDILAQIKTDYDGYYIDQKNNHIITFTPIPTKPIFLVAVNKDPQIFNSVTNLETESMLQLTASLVIISIIAGIIIWFIIGHPIQEFTEAANRIREGDLSTEVNLEIMNDELLILAKTFNQMTSQLHETVTGLETKLNELKEAQEALQTSEKRYRTIFDTASVSIWEEDITEFIKLLDGLKENGVTDFRTYFDENPEFLIKAFESVRVMDVNNQTLELYEASSKEEMMGSLMKIYTPDLMETFKEEAIAIANGSYHFETEIANLTLSGKKIETLMRVTIPESNTEKKNMLVSIMDISEQKENALRIQKQVEHLSALRQIDLAIASHLDLSSITNLLLSQIKKQLQVDAVNVLKFNRHLNLLQYISSTGFHTEALQNTSLRLGYGFAGRAALERITLFIQDLSEQTNPFSKIPSFSDENFVSYYGIPLIAKGEIKGVLEVFNRTPLIINQEWEEFVKDLATQAALAIDAATLWEEQQHITQELKIAYDSTLKGWSRALEFHDFETFGHSDRVTNLTVQLAEKLKIQNEKLIHIRRGAMLHDIGKMGVPESILNKPGKLTEEEWDIIRMHPIYARKLLSPIEFLKPATDIPYYHHEWWNGGGYPEGLSKEEIPLAARIFAVVDVWDALSQPRPYREAWSKEKVLQYIKDLSGIQFDPVVVEAFLSLILEKTGE